MTTKTIGFIVRPAEALEQNPDGSDALVTVLPCWAACDADRWSVYRVDDRPGDAWRWLADFRTADHGDRAKALAEALAALASFALFESNAGRAPVNASIAVLFPDDYDPTPADPALLETLLSWEAPE